MFDVLVYVYENYYDPESCPTPGALTVKLRAAGFDSDEIDDALDWLGELAVTEQTVLPLEFATRQSFRVYAPRERAMLDTEAQGYLAFLEANGQIDPLQREVIVERALALGETPISLEKLKIIVLMVMWSMQMEPDLMVLEELMPGAESLRTVH
jgi:Smg protein